ncbi:hypothetical protein ACWT_1980 [Actinoplanes sp. SE50]|uniref:hypothetical protein n=1 Tax=unclassified Actinoplanes TaxID=2626549 RepID=UPI00023EC230|nr:MULTISPECIES: hypothetical protein [unclassified Actinoplanes]AEV82999.1 hypothetical protein ACPL_2102 [Actinoplanes sp. SE50/110]ATO81395.1 hypothetical protein ACWT_1980 [Actinoplanes sp. SE50]SLL98802.1 hypothetical protein ACSP50_2029 [Actinoplanes sp. SE50/110]
MDIAMNAQPTAARVETATKVATVLSTVALAGTVAVAAHGGTVNTFMWVRGALLPIVAVVLYRMAAGGSPRALDRIRVLTVIMPIAIVGVDLIPGVCPLWYAAVQAVCMIPVVVAAVLSRRV